MPDYMRNIILLLTFITFLIGCQKDAGDEPANGIPVVATTAVTSVGSTSAMSGGTISADGGSPITGRGVCWGTSANPTIQNNKTSDGSGTGSFTSSLTGLIPNTTYYLRAYATNAAGTGYGNQVTFSTGAPSVYVLLWNESGSNRVQLWKNGIVTTFGNASPNAYPVGLDVSNGDVYVLANDYDNTGIHFSILWKNGVATNLPPANSYAEAYSLDVEGSDAYVVGHVNMTPTLWKNGVQTVLDNNTSSVASSVAVRNGDVYVAGSKVYNSMTSATLWKNGTPTNLLLNGASVSSADDVFVYNSDVYVCGEQGYTGLLWKNGTSISIPTPYHNAFTSIYVSQGDVYIAGTSWSGGSAYGVATVWKNGVPTYLSDGTTRADANDVFVAGNDVYVVGAVLSSNAPGATAKPVLWKNGVASILTNTDASAQCVVVY
jgi:hypothetical protein